MQRRNGRRASSVVELRARKEKKNPPPLRRRLEGREAAFRPLVRRRHIFFVPLTGKTARDIFGALALAR